MLGDRVVPAALAGKTATVLGDPDQPHTYTYIPEIGEGLAVLGEHPNAAGEVWHLPNDPKTRTTRQLVEVIYRLAGQSRTKLRSTPALLLRALGVVNPTVRELLGNLNGPTFVEFCRRLLHDAPGPVFLILDGHPAHRSTVVAEFAASTNGRLRLFFLPGYSPELNPDEWVWKNVKHDHVGRAGIHSEADLKHKALAALHRLQKLPHLIRSFFGDPNLRYITA